MIQVLVGESIVADVRGAIPDEERSRFDLLATGATAAGVDLSGVEAAGRWDLDATGFRALLDGAPKLRWVHSPGAGVESWPLEELATRGITLTNGAGVFAIPIAEWVLTAMLNAVKRTEAVRAAQRQRQWLRGVPAGELYGKTVLVLGSGGIGLEIIARAAAFGMRIWAANRSGRAVPGADRTITGPSWRDVLPDVDFVVVTVPLTAETRGMIGAGELARCRPDAWLINIGRGATIDEPALIDALRAGRLGGAALDTWTTEPLPTDSAAWSTPNMVVSPHMSAASPANRDRMVGLFVDNLRRFADGRPLVNVVDLAAGY